jgi:uncharacterized cupin superfamily protein
MKVKKPWGYELRWAMNDKYIGKILRIEPGQKLSRQYHAQKDETIYVLEGKLVLELGAGNDIIKLILHEGVLAAPSGGCTLIEVSTPELDDVIRLEDMYGRK